MFLLIMSFFLQKIFFVTRTSITHMILNCNVNYVFVCTKSPTYFSEYHTFKNNKYFEPKLNLQDKIFLTLLRHLLKILQSFDLKKKRIKTMQ